MWNLKKEKVEFIETVEKWLLEAEGNKDPEFGNGYKHSVSIWVRSEYLLYETVTLVDHT